MKLIPLTRGLWTLVDDCTYDLLSQVKWYAEMGNSGHWYARHKSGKFSMQMARLLLGLTDPTIQADHRSGNALDNRLCNLRPSTAAQNAMNRRAQGKYKGISTNYKGWKAQIEKDGIITHLGTYSTMEEAARAYDKAARLLFGEFAKLNYPNNT